MAGRGGRFVAAGYADPKPLIKVHGVPIIELVIRNVRPAIPHRFVFICQRDHAERFDLDRRLDAVAPGCVVIRLDGITEGAACTVLTAKAHIDGPDPLVIANSDQWVDVPIDPYLEAARAPGVDGL